AGGAAGGRAGGPARQGKGAAPDETPAAGDEVVVAIRPERLGIDPPGTPPRGSGWIELDGQVRQGTYLGDQTEYRVDTDQAGELVVRRQNAAGADRIAGFGPGDRVVISWHEEANLVLIS